jgi:hypothetical protein
MAQPSRSSFRSLVLGSALLVACGCGGASAPAATAADASTATTAAQAKADRRDPSELPGILEELHPTAKQRRELLALRAEIEPRLEPMADAGRDFALAGAKAASQCNPNSMALADAASWAVETGEQVRGDVLDGIDKLHRILTREQREALVARLLGDAKETKPKEDTDDGARSLGDALHLSIGQVFTLLERAGALRSAIEDKIDPWLGRAKKALLAFPDDDFAIRKYDIAEVPAVELAARFVRDAFRSMLPILDREQCKALGGFIKEAVEEQASNDRSPPRATMP